jgi:hypothetical protein
VRLLLAMLVAIGRIGVVEIPWIAVKLVRIVVGWVIRVARTGEATRLPGCSGRKIVGLPIAIDVAKILGFGLVV